MSIITEKWFGLIIGWLFLYLLGLPDQIKAQEALDTLHLEEILQLAREQSLFKTSAELNLIQANYDNRIFEGSLRPQVSLLGSLPNYVKTSNPIIQPNGTLAFQSIFYNNSSLNLFAEQVVTSTGGTIFIQSNLQRFDDFENDFKSYNGIPFRIGFRQPINSYNPFKWEKKLAPIRLKEAEKRYVAEMEQIHLEAIRLYFNLLLAHLNFEIAAANETSNQTLFEIAVERHELGNLSDSDLKQLQLELIRSSNNKNVAAQSLQSASIDIYGMLGIAGETKAIIPIMPMVDSIVVDLKTAMDEALANRDEVEGFLRNQILAEQAVEAVKEQGGFQANLTASFGFTRSGNALGEIYSDPQQEQIVALTLNVPILDWGQQKHRILKAKADLAFAQKQIAQDKIDFRNTINQAVLAFQNTSQQLQMVSNLRDLALERFDITRQSYLLGAISIRELSLSQGEKDQAIRDYTNTLRQYWEQYYLIRRLTLFDFKANQKIKYYR